MFKKVAKRNGCMREQKPLIQPWGRTNPFIQLDVSSSVLLVANWQKLSLINWVWLQLVLNLSDLKLI